MLGGGARPWGEGSPRCLHKYFTSDKKLDEVCSPALDLLPRIFAHQRPGIFYTHTHNYIHNLFAHQWPGTFYTHTIYTHKLLHTSGRELFTHTHFLLTQTFCTPALIKLARASCLNGRPAAGRRQRCIDLIPPHPYVGGTSGQCTRASGSPPGGQSENEPGQTRGVEKLPHNS